MLVVLVYSDLMTLELNDRFTNFLFHVTWNPGRKIPRDSRKVGQHFFSIYHHRLLILVIIRYEVLGTFDTTVPSYLLTSSFSYNQVSHAQGHSKWVLTTPSRERKSIFVDVGLQ